MSNEKLPMLREFDFEGRVVRTIMRAGEPWWVLADVCGVLDIADSRVAARRLDDDEKDGWIIPTLGGNQVATIINESGLYSLVMTSRKPEAKRFKKWVTGTVLPAIRKTGGYIAGEENFTSIDELNDQIIRLYERKAAAMEEKLAQVEQERDRLQIENEELEPDAQVARETFSMGRKIKLGDFCRRFDGVNTIQVKRALLRLGYLYRHSPAHPYRVYSQYRDTHFSEKRNEHYESQVDIFVRPAGEILLTKLYREGKLPMKVNFRKHAA